VNMGEHSLYQKTNPWPINVTTSEHQQAETMMKASCPRR